ncbi:hypothetical protein HHI36_016210 [Cryptolaemus montrouzieri]|uniref:Alpha-L-iduronidase n=1 Tax=Cryptolaemus montrouzieri TaxID=559131 RepID=A0ABD2NJV0_9CUCU
MNKVAYIYFNPFVIRFKNRINFDYMDELFDMLRELRLKPIFEIMGRSFPSDIENLVNPLTYWSNLTYTIVSRYIERFGVEEVSTWKFETWNEPDLIAYNVMNFTLKEYLDYVNGCARGLKSAFNGQKANPNNAISRLGGPAGLFRTENHPLCWGLLKSCRGVKKAECPIQFVSFHRKGDSDVSGLLNGTLQLLDLLREKFPDLEEMPIANDEADLLKNWSRDEEWRSDARYAAMVALVVIRFHKEIILGRGKRVEILSNDNGFMNYHPYYFTQRTLLTRFQMNLTIPPHDQFIKKPVYSVMGLLSYLGDTLLEEIFEEQDVLMSSLSTKISKPNYSAIATLLVYVNDTEVSPFKNKTININLKNLEFGGKYVVYFLNNFETNPYQVWLEAGSPFYPEKDVRKEMRNNEEPKRLKDPQEFSPGSFEVTVNISIPSVVLLHACYEPRYPPGRVTDLTIQNVTRYEVLLNWSDENMINLCIRTYEVEFESRCGNGGNYGIFRRVNLNDIIFLSYHHSPTGDGECEATRGRYRVRAVDYWDRPGHYSDIVCHPPRLY